jgi:Ca-activated chloride channel family protein
MRNRIFYLNQVLRAFLVLVLLASLLLGGVSLWRASAQQQQQGQPTNQPTTRPRRSSNETTSTQPTPLPTPRDDDETVEGDEVVRVETDLTNILFTAVDKKKRFVTDLKQEDIRILEDGLPQEVFAFARQTDLPLSLAIVVDRSVSQERTLPIEKAAARTFIDSIIRPSKDEAAVVSFTGEATLEQGLTGSVARVRSALERIEFVPPSGYIVSQGRTTGTPPISDTNQEIAGNTAIWDAIWVTSEEILTQTSDKTRRAIILLTDGVNSIGQVNMEQAIDRAIKADVVIYAIGIGDSFYHGVDEGSLKKVAERTGGRAFFPDGESDLRAAFALIEQELRSQFLVAYSPVNKKRDGSFRRVQIEIINPELRKQNLRLNYRQGYFARTPIK